MGGIITALYGTYQLIPGMNPGMNDQADGRWFAGADASQDCAAAAVCGRQKRAAKAREDRDHHPYADKTKRLSWIDLILTSYGEEYCASLDRWSLFLEGIQKTSRISITNLELII
jgi:hypothetical protein